MSLIFFRSNVLAQVVRCHHFSAVRHELSVAVSITDMSLLDDTLRDLKARRDELAPLVDEHARIDAAIRAMEGTGSTPQRRSKAAPKRRARKPSASNGRGRPAGALRVAIYDAFSGDEALATDQLREAVEAKGVTATTANLHQSLGRMVSKGELSKVGRGRYKRGDTRPA